MKHLILVLLILHHDCLVGQTDSLCQAILDQIVKARGALQIDPPSIRIVPRQKNIAAYSALTNEIIIEEKTLELSQDLDPLLTKPALAFIIGHEFTHFLQHHEWKTGSTSPSFFLSSSELNNQLARESEADRYGAFLCYLAGYNHQEAPAQIIEKLYHDYHEHSDVRGYPSTTERIKLTYQVCQQVTDLTVFFEAANYLSILGHYGWSQTLYEYIGKFIDHKEIDTNAGANQLKYYLSNNPDLVYPIQIKRRLNLRDADLMPGDSLLTLAIANFSRAIIKDPTDYSLYTNLTIAYLAAAKLQSAQIIIDQLKALDVRNPLSEHWQLLEILLRIKRGAEETVQTQLNDLARTAKSLEVRAVSKKNLEKLNDQMITTVDTSKVIRPIVSTHMGPYQRHLLNASDPIFPIYADLGNSENAVFLKLTKGHHKLEIVLAQRQLHPDDQWPTTPFYLKDQDAEGNPIHIYVRD